MRCVSQRQGLVRASLGAAGAFILWLAVGLLLWPRGEAAPSPTPEIVFVANSGIRLDSLLDDVGTGRLRWAIAYTLASPASRLVTSRSWMFFPPKFGPAGFGASSDYGQHRMLDTSALAYRWTVLPGVAASTHDEAIQLRRAFPQTRRIAVVTSTLHTRRACATFRRAGFDVSCLASGWDGAWWKIPYRLAYEMAAMIKYRIRGWI